MANSNNSINPAQESEVEVLYQKLGDRWFAFSIIDNEVFMTPITEEKILEIKQERAPEAESNSL